MIMDSSLQFADKQAVTSSAASAAIVDASIARNLGVGFKQLFLVVLCTAAMTDASSDSTVTPSLRSSATAANNALTNTIVTILTGQAFAALSAAGTMQVLPLPPSANYLEYLDVYFTVANGDLTTGKFSAFIVSDADLQAFYAAGYSIT